MRVNKHRLSLEEVEARAEKFRCKVTSAARNLFYRNGYPIPKWARDSYNAYQQEYKAQHLEQWNKVRRERKIKKIDRVRELVREGFSRYYGDNTDKCFARTYTWKFLRHRDLLVKGWESHHFDSDNWKNFIYLPRRDHRNLHRLYGMKNEDLTWKKVLKALPMLENYIIFKDGKIVSKKGAAA